MSDTPDPEDLEEEHSHPMGWFQVILYITLLGALASGIYILARGF
ncbi:MAG: hypothetical protein ACPGN3_16420 [Opitutales bacterium]